MSIWDNIKLEGMELVGKCIFHNECEPYWNYWPRLPMTPAFFGCKTWENSIVGSRTPMACGWLRCGKLVGCANGCGWWGLVQECLRPHNTKERCPSCCGEIYPIESAKPIKEYKKITSLYDLP